MYKVVKIHDYIATRDVGLRNEDTGTNDICFDDSELVSKQNFGFIEEGKTYDCKIKLFGEFPEKRTDISVEVKVVDSTVIIGKGVFLKVQIKNDIYFIPKKAAVDIDIDKIMLFDFTRKDLIQVNDIIQHDLLL